VEINIFDNMGRRVRTPHEQKTAAGQYSTQWDAKDDAAQELPSGVYYCAMQGAKGGNAFRKMVLIR
jgi:flagellar hook assembly protein FlgD